MLAGNSPIDLKADSTLAMTEPSNEGSSAFLTSVTQAIGRFGFCEGCIGNLSIYVILEMPKHSLLVPLVLNSTADGIHSYLLTITSEEPQFASCICLQQFLVFSRIAVLVEKPGA